MREFLYNYKIAVTNMGQNFGERLFQVVFILIIGYIVSKVILKIIKTFLDRRDVDKSMHPFMLNGLRIIIWIVILMTAFATLGVPIGSLLTMLGAAGLAVALALQNSLGNIAGGIIILVTKPFKNGDYIDIQETAGIVEAIDLLYSTLRTFDNKIVTVPNGKITSGVLTNYTRENIRRVDINLGIGYGDNISKVRDILMGIAESDERILLDPEPVIVVSGHGDSAVNLIFKVWADTENYWNIYYDMLEVIKVAFDESGISIPFPQLDVHNIKDKKFF